MGVFTEGVRHHRGMSVFSVDVWRFLLSSYEHFRIVQSFTSRVFNFIIFKELGASRSLEALLYRVSTIGKTFKC